VYTVEAYRDEQGRPRQRTITSHGRLDALLAGDLDAMVKLKAQVAEATAQRAGRRGTIEFDTGALSDGVLPVKVGGLVVEGGLERLGVGKVLTDAGKAGRWQVDAAAVLRGLVAGRVVWPGSKRATAARSPLLFAGPVLDLGHTYQGLGRIGDHALALQQATSRGVGRTPGSLAVVDYDVTNYFFHIDTPDEQASGKDPGRGQATRKKGASKEHRVDPIIQMGLFCDSDGIPVCYRLFDGNVPDVSTLAAAVTEFKAAFTPGRVVVVGDKAMNARTNLGALHQSADGWIVSESARNSTAKIREWILDDQGWVWNPEHTTAHKSMPITRDVPVTAHGVPAVPAVTVEKLIATWTAHGAARDARLREQILAQADTFVANEALYRAGTKRGARKYITAETVNQVTGELALTCHTRLALDQAKINTEQAMDGYQLIRTTETTTPDEQVIARYRQLVQIEDAFRITKTDLQARPVYVWTPLHIEAHFLVCFLALLITRLLQHQTGLPTGKLLTAIRGFEAIPVGQGVHRLCRPADWDLIDTALGATLNQTWATLTDIRAWHRTLIANAKRPHPTTPSTP
jgi:hypothetical protein